MLYRWRFLGEVLRQTFSARYFSLRYFAWISVVMMILYIIVFLVRLLQALDHLIFPKFRREKLPASIYILANPRSGTTLLHRIMVADSQFTFQRLYQTIFPSIIWYKFFEWLGRFDRILGGPLARYVLKPLNRLFFGQWDGVHEVGFQQSEEDEAMWIFPWLTPAALIFFPFIRALKPHVYVDGLPRRDLDRINTHLYRILQRHMYAAGEGKILLGKNAVAATRVHRYLEVMPDMRIIHLYRHPYESITSALSMFSKKMWEMHSPQCVGATEEVKAAAEIWCESYLLLMNLRDELPPERYIEFSYTELASDPKGTVEKVYARFGLEVGPEYAAYLEAESERAQKFESQHEYDLTEYGLSKDWIYEQLKPAFERYGFER